MNNHLQWYSEFLQCDQLPPYEQLPTILQQASPVPVKSSHLEEIITNIKKKKGDEYFEKQFSQNLTLHLKRDLKSEKTKTVDYIKDCFGKKLDNMDLLYLGYPTNWDISQTV